MKMSQRIILYNVGPGCSAPDVRQQAGVNFFKIDGVAGDPAELAAEIEAILGIAAELHISSDGKTIWINLTSGTCQVLSGPNRAVPLRCAMRFELHSPTSIAMQENLFASDANPPAQESSRKSSAMLAYDAENHMFGDME